MYTKVICFWEKNSLKLIISNFQLIQSVPKTLENEMCKYRSCVNFLSNFTLIHCRKQFLLKDMNGLCGLKYFMNQYVNELYSTIIWEQETL